MRIAIFAGISAFLVGCFPFPHRANVTPPVTGIITRAGEPLSGAKIAICEATAKVCCTGREETAQVEADGRFSAAPARETRWVMYVMAHSQFHWCVAVDDNGSRRTAGPYQQYTLVDSGPVFGETVRCSFLKDTVQCEDADDAAGGAPNKSLERTRDR
jgi:hypothetical protein